MKVNFSNDGLSKPERLFAIGGGFFLAMAFISSWSYYFASTSPFAHEMNFLAWSKVYLCLSMIMGIISLNYLGIRDGWLVKLNPRLSQLHFWLTFVGVCFVLVNLDSYDHESYRHFQCRSLYYHPTLADQFKDFVTWKPDMDGSIFMILAGQFVWGINFMYNLLIGNHSE